MNYTVEISQQADEDLREIYCYIAFKLRAPENAVGQVDRLEERIMSLAQMPRRFKRYDREPWHSRELRQMPVDNFIVFYIPVDVGRNVTVLRIMYAGRDIDSELNSRIDGVV